jgi:hypothetical protein
MALSRQASSLPGFFSGGLSSNPGQVSRGGIGGLFPLYLFLATIPCDALSAFLTFCGRVVYPTYASSPQLFNNSALRDQELAGAMMWVWVTFAYLIPAVVITMQILSPADTPRQEPVRAAWPTPAVRSLNGGEAEEL